MLHYCHKTRGAISVFLVIIMMPMMLFSWIMIDMARVKLAYTRVVNATDLTLNTALSNFDNIMKDMYGLFAMSQTSDELFENLETYYTKNLMIAGLDEEDAMAFSDNIIYGLMNMSASSEPEYPYTDFLKTEMGSFTWDVSPNASLANPEIMKDQIVNFMKYRAPLGIGMKLIDIIKSFKTVDEQAEVIENKTKYYETQSELEQHLRNAWGFIERYRDLYQGTGKEHPLNSTYLGDFIRKFDYKDNKSDPDTFSGVFYTQFARTIAFQLLMLKPQSDPKDKNTTSIKDWNYKYFPDKFPFEIKKEGKKYTITINRNTYVIETDKTVENDKEIEKPSQIEEQEIESFCINYENRAYNSINGADKSLSDIIKSGSDYPIIQGYKNLGDNYDEKMMYKAFIYRVLTENNEDFFNKLENYCRLLCRYSEYYSTNNLFGAKPGEDKANHTRLLKDLNQIGALFKETEYQIPDTTHSKFGYGFLIEYIQTVYKGLVDGRTNLEGAQKELELAIALMEGDLETNRTNWKNSSNSSKIQGTDFAEDNLKEVSTVEEKFKKSDVEHLKEIVDQKLETFTGEKGLIPQLEKIQFYDKRVVDINSLYEYYQIYLEKSSFETNGKRGYREEDFQNDYMAIIDNLDPQFSKDAFVYKYLDNKDLNPAAIEFDNAGPLYNYMSNVYKGAGDSEKKTVEEDSSEGKTIKKEIKNQNNNLASGNMEDAEPKQIDESKVYKPDKKVLDTIDGTFPSQFDMGSLPEDIKFGNFGNVGNQDKDKDNWKASTKAMDGAGKGTKDFFKELFAALEKGAEYLRDDLYIEEYIMGMFSYQTIEKETFVEQYKKELFNSGDPSLAQQYQFLKFHLYDDSGELSDNFGVDFPNNLKFDAEDFMSKIETLTNIPMSPSNNAQYLNEVEYIIYGKGSSDSVGNTIFALRFILNTISAFMNSELRSVARTIALAIFGYPPLTFLVPIAQIAIIIACAIGESVIDKTLLLGGFKVPVFKSKDNFIVSPRGIAKSAKKILINKGKEVAKKGISYAKSKIDECVSYLSDKADGILDDAQKGTEDFINKQLDKTLSDAYDEKIGGYVDSVTDGMVQLIQQNMNIYLMSQESKDDSEGIDAAGYQSITEGVLSGLKDYLGLNSMDKNGLEYMVKNAAYEYIKENGKR